LCFPKHSFEAILTPRFADFDNEIKPLGLQLSQLTLALYNEVQTAFLPTPDRFHYLFNIRDVAKVVQGVLQAQKRCFDTRDSVLRLWLHECLRVFSDRFLQDGANDFSRFRDILGAKLKERFDVDWKALTSEADDPEQGPIFCSFLRAAEDPPYEEVTNLGKLRNILEERLADYNMEPKLIPMNLVLFKDALRHVCRIHRVLRQPRGNLMLVGVGGSGRQSLTRLASYMCEYGSFNIEITKMYRAVEFHEDLKTLYLKTGVDRRPTTFLFNDTQVSGKRMYNINLKLE
jgi:dynein heavy chain